MIETDKSAISSPVYRLIELPLILLVATVGVKRVFSAMNVVKTDLHNKIRAAWINDSLAIYNKKKIFVTIDNKVSLHCFLKMQTR